MADSFKSLIVLKRLEVHKKIEQNQPLSFVWPITDFEMWLSGMRGYSWLHFTILWLGLFLQ